MIDKKDIENITICTEIHVKEYMDKMEYLSDKIQEWVDTYGEIPKEYQIRLNKAFSLDGKIK